MVVGEPISYCMYIPTRVRHDKSTFFHAIGRLKSVNIQLVWCVIFSYNLTHLHVFILI